MAHPDYVHIGTPLIRTIEECSELIKILCKVSRFGWFASNPLEKDSIQNIELVRREILDVRGAIDDLQEQILRVLEYYIEGKEK